jgi:hypothetical protein
VVARFRAGKWYGVTVKTTTLTAPNGQQFPVAAPESGTSAETREFLAWFAGTLTPRERELFDCRMGGQQLREIAKLLEVSFARVYNINRAIEMKLAEAWEGRTPPRRPQRMAA